MYVVYGGAFYQVVMLCVWLGCELLRQFISPGKSQRVLPVEAIH